MPRFVKVAKAPDVTPGMGKVVEVEDRVLALFNIQGEFFCIDNSCPHQMGPLGEGYLQGDVVSCPWHGWQFNVKTGASHFSDDLRVQSYQVRRQGDDLEIDLDGKTKLF